MDPLIEKRLGEWRLDELRRAAAVGTARSAGVTRPGAAGWWRRTVGGAMVRAGRRVAGDAWPPVTDAPSILQEGRDGR